MEANREKEEMERERLRKKGWGEEKREWAIRGERLDERKSVLTPQPASILLLTISSTHGIAHRTTGSSSQDADDGIATSQYARRGE